MLYIILNSILCQQKPKMFLVFNNQPLRLAWQLMHHLEFHLFLQNQKMRKALKVNHNCFILLYI